MIHLQEGKNLWIYFQEGSKLIHTKKIVRQFLGKEMRICLFWSMWNLLPK